MNFRGVIAEDEELLRTALSSLLKEAWPQLEIVAECDDGASALESIAELQPDVAFLDIRMPGLTGIEVARGMADAILEGRNDSLQEIVAPAGGEEFVEVESEEV